MLICRTGVEPEKLLVNRHVSTSVLLVCLLFLFGSQAARAQYRFDHWTADNGLPQNSVRDIVQTRDGYLWLTTFDGLVRFDGVRFTVFNKSNSPGILNNRFVQLYEDAEGDLWASTENSGLTRLHKGRFTTYTTKDGTGKRSAIPRRFAASAGWVSSVATPPYGGMGRAGPSKTYLPVLASH